MKTILTLYLSALLFIKTQAQLTLISSYNNYNNTLSMLQNPAYISDSRPKYQINLFAVDLNAGNTAFEVKRNVLFKTIYNSGSIEKEDYFRISDKAFHNGWSNVDMLGPAISFNVHDNNNTIGIYSRLRSTVNISNVNDPALDIVTDNIQTNTNYNISNSRLQTNIFGEIGVTYSHAFLNESKHIIKLGITAKYILGMAAFAIHATNTVINYKPTRDNFRTLTGDARILYSKDIGTINLSGINTNDIVDLLQKNINHNIGIGTDIGFVYEYRPEKKATNYLQIKDWLTVHDYPYQWRLGLSITDIGFINYKAGIASGNYALTGTNKPENTFEKLPDETVDQYINRLKTVGMLALNKGIGKFTMLLPTAIHANADWHIYKPFYVNANLLINIISKTANNNATYYPTTFSIAPRFETKWLTTFLPMSFNEFKNINVGVGIQAGPLLIGSTAVISNLLKNKIRSLDFFAGLNFSIYKKRSDIYCYFINK